MTRIIKARLMRLSVDVTRASSGREGLKLAHSHRPDAIITDLEMDRGDGEYLLKRLKGRTSTANIPVIVISGLADEKRISALEQQGAVAVLRKPIPFDRLFDELRERIADLKSSSTGGQQEASLRSTLNHQNLRFDGPDKSVSPSEPFAHAARTNTDFFAFNQSSDDEY